jgi:tetratricopeptide (TPR) repeat protein
MNTAYENRKLYWLLLFTLLIVVGSYVVRLAGEGLIRPAFLDNILGPSEPPIPDTMPPAQQIEFWSNRLSPNTKDYITLTQLGRSYLALARETGDAAAYARAEEALRRALELNPRYDPAKALIGSVLIGQHNFAEALALAQEALAANPDEYQALAVSGDAALELGDYAVAEATYQRLVDAVPDGPSYSRMSRLAWLQGRPDDALDWMRRAADEAVTLDIGGEELAWYRFQLGELYFNTGNLRHAQKWYDESQQALPDYYLARAGLGKVAAAEGRIDEAIAAYTTLVAQLPQPNFVAYLGDLYALRGDQTAAQEQYDTVAFINQLDEAQQVLYNRQMALFFANHNTRLDEALAYAEAELEARQDVYAYDTLAWVLYRLGRYEEAADASNKALALGTQDAVLFYHAGMIAAALGNDDGAAANLARALDLNPHFDLLQATAARETLATLAN